MLKAMGATLGTNRESGRPRVDCLFESRGKVVTMRVVAMAIDYNDEEDSIMSCTIGVWRLAGLTTVTAAAEGTARYP